MILLNITLYFHRCALMFLGRPSFPWSFLWLWAPSLCIRLAVARLASAASTAWTWSGFAWPSLSSLSVCFCPTLGFVLFHQPESDVILWNVSLTLILLCFLTTAPPDYSSVVSDEEAVQNSTAVQPEEDLSGVLQRSLMAYVQEFRLRPPPVYSEVSRHAKP